MAAAKPDFYDILGVTKSATSEELKKAYRKQALEWHPDRHKDQKQAAEKRFKEINEAYQILSDSSKRSAYDQYGHAAFSPGGGFAGGRGAQGQGFNPFGQGGFSYSYSGNGEGVPFDFGDPFEIFEQFFGGASPFRQQRVPRYSIAIDFMEAVKGVTKEAVVEGKKRKIKIPAGVDEGSRINFGDFILSINVKPSNIFERDGLDIYVNVAIPFSVAVLGGEIEVPTVDKPVKLKIKSGTESASMMRLKGKGVQSPRGSAKGDQYIKITVDVPTKLNRDQKKLIEELRRQGL
ncbi:MAG: DnaJ C-terminal domain-containing protein [Patescibacteria group bacterium]